MSGASSWLQKQRKSDLVTLADQAGLKDYDGLKKTDLEAALDEHMRANQSTLAKDSKFDDFFRRIQGPTSPVKREGAGTVTVSNEVKKPRQRRVTKAREEAEPTDSSEPEMGKALAAITPRRSTLSLASNVRLPPSPAVVADRIEQQTANLRSGAAEIWAKSGITEYSESLRDKLSSTLTIEMLALFVELWGLQGEVLPIRHLAMIPASRTLGTPEIPAKVPDLFALLTRSFWAPFLVWLTTSLALPVGFAYFFNLTLKSKHGRVAHARGATHPANQYDPLTFNVAKALVTWLVYNKGVSFGGLIGEESIEKVDANVPGGYQGVMIGAGIGVLSSFYEAVLKN